MKKVFASITILVVLALMSGCATKAKAVAKKIIHPDGTVEFYSETSIMSTGDKASEVAADGMFADGTEEDLGSGFKKASGKQESTGIEGTLKGMGDFMTGMAKFMAVAQTGGIAPIAVTPQATSAVKQSAPVTATDSSTPVATATDSSTPVATARVLNPSQTTVTSIPNYEPLSTKVAEAKISGKPLVVIAGSPSCGFCEKLRGLLDADTAFTGRTDIVLYRETNEWSVNGALDFTGGGPAPIVRVVQYDTTSGKAVCDKTLHRPSIADIVEAINACNPVK